MPLFITCKENFEKILTRELALYNVKVDITGNGWLLTQSREQNSPIPHNPLLSELCFAYQILENPTKICTTSINNFAEHILSLFFKHIEKKQIINPWPFLFFSSGNEQLIHHAKTIEKCFFTKLSKKMSRVAKLSKEGLPPNPKFIEGFFINFIDFNQAYVSFNALSTGQQRMQMDPQAPSRSYLKIEEAFQILGKEPTKNETVIDLGAAPGGWSFSALKRGALVTAIDNGPLKEPVKSHPHITHLKEDALKYKHRRNEPVDWLFCDILDNPDLILNLIHTWLSQRWCRHFIINLKIGRADPIMLLKKIRDPHKGLLIHCKILHIRQLYHDREEITLMGEIK